VQGKYIMRHELFKYLLNNIAFRTLFLTESSFLPSINFEYRDMINHLQDHKDIHDCPLTYNTKLTHKLPHRAQKETF
jgi:hypothetical protein